MTYRQQLGLGEVEVLIGGEGKGVHLGLEEGDIGRIKGAEEDVPIVCKVVPIERTIGSDLETNNFTGA